MVKSNAKTQLIWSLLLFFYLIVRFGFTNWLDSLGTYTSYSLEVILILITLILNKINFIEVLNFNKKLSLFSILLLPLGLLTFKATSLLQVQVPFDLTGVETLIMLLIVAPILEEFIFRFFCWHPFEKINKTIALIVTSLLFSYSHLHALWFTPPEIHNFIFYQTAYTFILALICGYAIFKYKSLSSSILMHFFFNLGFYLASVF